MNKDNTKCQYSPECHLEIYDNNKCIFHCEKDDWFELNNKNRKTWKTDKLNDFWSKYIQNDYRIPPKSIIPQFYNINGLFDNELVFYQCNFYDDFQIPIFHHIKNLLFI